MLQNRKWPFAQPLVLLLGSAAATAAPLVSIPRVDHAPRLEDSEGMAANGAAKELQPVSGFLQNHPSDGKPATERTEAYFGYDHSNLYIVVAAETGPACRLDPARTADHQQQHKPRIQACQFRLTLLPL